MTVPSADPAGRPPASAGPPPLEAEGVDELLRNATEEAARLLGAEGALLYLLDPATGRLRFTHDAGISGLPPDHWLRGLELDPGVGMFGRAVADGRVVVTGDYETDDSFTHADATDRFVRDVGIRAMVVAPMVVGGETFGALGTYSGTPDAFTAPQVALVRALADHAALALGRARLIEELGRSREALARRAEEERSLREIGSRLSRLSADPGDVLLRIVHEAARLLGAERARLDLLEPLSGGSLWAYPAEAAFNDHIAPGELVGGGADLPIGLAGLALREARPVVTDDYLGDGRFRHYPEGDKGVRDVSLHSVIAVPIPGDEGALGVLQAGHREHGAFGDDAIRLIATLAGEASIAITNARLVDRVAASQAALARTADAERALREIARRLMSIQDPAQLLQGVTDEAARLLGSSGAVIELLDPATAEVRWAHDAGISPDTRAEWRRRAAGRDGALAAIRSRSVVVTDDYAADPRFADGEANADFLSRAGIRSIAFAPMIGEAAVLGTLAVFAPEPGRFGAHGGDLLAALADLATIAIHNAELIRELGRSREETARRAETERSLREIAARVTSIRDPETILELIVEEARRVLGSDGAHLTRMSEDHTFLRPVVVAGGMDDDDRAFLRRQEFPIDGGINGLAAGQGRVVWTPEYATDPRIPRDDDDLDVAVRMGLAAVAAAPLRAPGGEVIGTLAVSYRNPGPIPSDRLATLQALADHAAIALSNSDLLARLEASEARYRGLVQSSPDLIFEMDGSGVYTFYSDRTEEVIGWEPEELIGHSFTEFVDMTSFPAAAERLATIRAHPGTPYTDRLLIRHKADGRLIPFEVSVVGQVDEAGELAAIRGVARDISERERLGRELRDSEERYRSVVQSSPDLIWATNRQGRYVFVSDRVRDLLGWDPGEVLGRPFREFVAEASVETANAEWARLAVEPGRTQTQRLDLRHRDGSLRPFEVSSVAVVRDGEVENVYGIARDVAERERLERELRDSEERYRFLVENSPDLVWMADADGRFTFISDQARPILGWDPAELIGRSFADLAPDARRRRAEARFRWLRRHPREVHRSRLKVLARDGRELAMEITGIGMLDSDGTFMGAHGAGRDISERERMEEGLRRQAAELASSEERSHLARELHDSVTQALFSMTLLSRSIELLLERDPSQVPQRLAALRELQRDALAEMRALIFELRPGNIEEHGLIQALRTHSASLSGRIGLPIVVEADLPDRPSIETEEALYRIAQEALHNVVKHAGAREVRVEVDRLPEGVHLRVTDDGRGFVPSEVPDGHLGLAGMRARAERLGGRLTVTAARGQGTVVDVVLPAAIPGEAPLADDA